MCEGFVSFLVDARKTFDTVNHQRLFSKLENYGNEGVPFQLFIPYLGNKRECIELGKIKSDYCDLLIGVAQRTSFVSKISGSPKNLPVCCQRYNDGFLWSLTSRTAWEYKRISWDHYNGCDSEHVEET